MTTLKYRVGNLLLSVDSFDVPIEGDIYNYTTAGIPTTGLAITYNDPISYNTPIKYNGGIGGGSGFSFSEGRDKLLALLNRS